MAVSQTKQNSDHKNNNGRAKRKWGFVQDPFTRAGTSTFTLSRWTSKALSSILLCHPHFGLFPTKNPSPLLPTATQSGNKASSPNFLITSFTILARTSHATKWVLTYNSKNPRRHSYFYYYYFLFILLLLIIIIIINIIMPYSLPQTA